LASRLNCQCAPVISPAISTELINASDALFSHPACLGVCRLTTRGALGPASTVICVCAVFSWTVCDRHNTEKSGRRFSRLRNEELHIAVILISGTDSRHVMPSRGPSCSDQEGVQGRTTRSTSDGSAL